MLERWQNEPSSYGSSPSSSQSRDPGTESEYHTPTWSGSLQSGSPRSGSPRSRSSRLEQYSRPSYFERLSSAMHLITQHKLNFVVHPGSGKRCVTLEVGDRLDEGRSRSRSPLIRCRVQAGVFHCQHQTEGAEKPEDDNEIVMTDGNVSDGPDDDHPDDDFSSDSSDNPDDEFDDEFEETSEDDSIEE